MILLMSRERIRGNILKCGDDLLGLVDGVPFFSVCWVVTVCLSFGWCTLIPAKEAPTFNSLFIFVEF